MPLERLLSHIAYSLLVASKHGSNSECGDSNRRYRMSVGRNSAHSTQRPNPTRRAKPSIYTAPPAIQPSRQLIPPSFPPRSSAANSSSLPTTPPQSLTPRPIPFHNLRYQVPPLPTASTSASLHPVSCQQSGSRPIARASIISALPRATSGNKLRGAADRAAWPAGQCGVAGLSQQNPNLRNISRLGPRTAGAEGWVVRGGARYLIVRAGESTVRDWGGACGRGSFHAWQLGRVACAYRSLAVPGRARE